MRNVPSLETVERDYAPQGVKFYYIYKALAHPETNGYITPFNLQERLMHVAEAKRTLGSRIPWICDTMENDLKHALGDRPNSEFIIGPDGKIVVSRQWSSPSELRRDLADLVGPVEQPTTIADLNMKTPPPPHKAATGIVPRVQLPGQMSPLITTPLDSKTPHYAKLRVESGGNQLYLGFFLDPLYKVHWNNKAPAIEYSIETPDGVTISPNKGRGPKVAVDADADPREFLVDVTGMSSEPMKVVVKYFACDDAETFCVPVTQEYLVSFERDRDGGNRRSFGSGRAGGPGGERGPGLAGRGPVGPGGPGGPGARGFAAQSPEQMAKRVFEQHDLNQDGQLSLDEMPDRMKANLQRFDTNRDRAIDKPEFKAGFESMRRSGPAGRGAREPNR